MGNELRPELRAVFQHLLSASAHDLQVSLDQVGEALGVLAVTTEEIDLLLTALENENRRITGPQGGGVEKHLGKVVAAARALSQTHGRKPTLTEVAAHAELTLQQVRDALALLRIMQR
jgi:hypothetical protein